MRVYQFTEQPYYPAWNDHAGSLRVNLLNRKCDPRIAADLFHRYYDEWQIADELGLDIMLNEHHQTATCMSSSVAVGLAVLARITKQARLLVLGYPIGHRPDPLRAAEELSTIDVISRGRLDMGFIKGIPYEIAASNRNPTELMDRFWEAHDFILKAMTTHDEAFNWDGEFFQYRHVNVWPRVWQEPHPPIWTTTGSTTQARLLGERGYVMATLGSGYNTRPLYDAYRRTYPSIGMGVTPESCARRVLAHCVNVRERFPNAAEQMRQRQHADRVDAAFWLDRKQFAEILADARDPRCDFLRAKLGPSGGNDKHQDDRRRGQGNGACFEAADPVDGKIPGPFIEDFANEKSGFRVDLGHLPVDVILARISGGQAERPALERARFEKLAELRFGVLHSFWSPLTGAGSKRQQRGPLTLRRQLLYQVHHLLIGQFQDRHGHTSTAHSITGTADYV